jgi:hypothetical protein
MNNADVGRLIEALRAVVNTAITKGLTPRDYEHAVTWWEPYDENGSTAHTVVRTAADFRFVARMLHAEPCMAQLRSRANELRKIKWPEFVVDDTAETICDGYFSAVRSVAVDESVLQKIGETYIAEVQSDELVYATVFQVSQFSAPEAFKLDGRISFRPVSNADIEHFGYEPLPVRRSPRLNKRDWICTVTQTFRMDDFTAPHRSRDHWDRLIGALGLSQEGDAWFSLLCEGPTSPFLRGFHYGTEHRIHSSPHGPRVRLDLEDVDRYRTVFEYINAICDRKPNNLLLAFRRFRAAAGREVIDDKIADLAIGLESLLTPDSATGEISFKFRIRGAALLPDRFGSPRDRMKLMKNLYKARCDIVHGSSSRDSDRRSLMNTATDVFRIVFDELARVPTSVEDSIAELDAEMTKGGERWLARFAPTSR